MTARDLSHSDFAGLELQAQRNRFAEQMFTLMEEEEVKVNAWPGIVFITWLVLMCALVGYYGMDIVKLFGGL